MCTSLCHSNTNKVKNKWLIRMRSSPGLNRVGIAIQGLFLTARLHPKTKSSRDELESFYRGDVSVYMFARLKLGFTWMIVLLRAMCLGMITLYVSSGKTVPRVGFIRIILSEDICFRHDFI